MNSGSNSDFEQPSEPKVMAEAEGAHNSASPKTAAMSAPLLIDQSAFTSTVSTLVSFPPLNSEMS